MGQYIGFQLCGKTYAIPILIVQEIIKPLNTTKIPNTPDYFEGVLNLRGANIPIVNLRKKLYSVDILADKLTDESLPTCRIIIINTGQVTFGIIVDLVTGVTTIDEDKIEHNVKLMEGSQASAYIKGIINLSNIMVMILDLEKLLNLNALVNLAVEGSDNAGLIELKSNATNNENSSNISGIKKQFVDKLLDEIFRIFEAWARGDVEEVDLAVKVLSSYDTKGAISEIDKLARKIFDSIGEKNFLMTPCIKDIPDIEMPDDFDKFLWAYKEMEDIVNNLIVTSVQIKERDIKLRENLAIIKERFNKISDITPQEQEAFSFISNSISQTDYDLTKIMRSHEFMEIVWLSARIVYGMVNEMDEQLNSIVEAFDDI